MEAHKQQGFGHIGLITAVIVAAVVGFGGWYVWQKNQAKDSAGNTTMDKAVQEAIKNAKCDYDDKDLCKFFTGWKAQPYYTIDATIVSDGTTTHSVVKTEGQNKFSTKIDGNTPYEIIVIDKTTYTKASNGTWWKQTGTDTTSQVKPSDIVPKEPGAAVSDAANAPKISYKKIGKEKCGSLTCFKYQEVNPSDTKTTSYMWFDDKDYQLRRSQNTSESGSYDATYSYAKVTISEPSPTKELGPGQYIVPGENEPTTLPSTGDNPDLQQVIEQYQQTQ